GAGASRAPFAIGSKIAIVEINVGSMHETLGVRLQWLHVGVLTLSLLSACATASAAALIERAPPDDGLITSVAIARDGRAIAAGTSYPAKVYWWRWNGRQGSWTLPTRYISALGWERAGTLLVGDYWHETRIPDARWWRLGQGGAIVSDCRATPRYDMGI